MFTSLSHTRTGIDFKNWVKESESFNVLDYGYLYNGAGVAVGDINNDGLEDIYFASNLTKNRLYINKGNFRFRDITDKAGVAGPGTWSTGVSMADINGDGFLDIYVCTSTDGRAQYRKNLLYINNGNSTFTESAAKYGIDDAAYSTHSIFFDYDKDGDLDLFVINHALNAMAVPKAELKKVEDPNYEHKLFKNTGDRFVDVSKEAGMIQNIMNFGLGVAVADFNNDKWPDIYVCNDYFEQDYLYINQHNGTFSDQLDKYFDHVSLSSMGTDAADINNDGFIDLLTLDMLPEDNYGQKLVAGPDNYDKVSILKNTGFYHQSTRNMLQLNNHGSYFTEIGQYAGIYSTNWSWTPLLYDFDNNGLKDLYISNGYGKNNTHMDFIKLTVEEVIKKRGGAPMMSRMGLVEKIPPTKLKNYLFRNNGDLTFTNVTDTLGDEMPSLSNGTAYADFDNDGDMDLVANQVNDYALVYRNNSSENGLNNFIKIRFEGSGMNKEGIGSRVQVFCKDKTYTQEFMPSRGYMSSGSHSLIFGIGNAAVIDSLQVIWPDMREQVITSVGANQTITLRNNEATEPGFKTIPVYNPLFVQLNEKSLLDFRHTENEYNDFSRQILLPHMLSTQGPHIAGGDVNNDGLEDFFFSGAKGNPGRLYFQKKNGSFELVSQTCFEEDRESEDIGALFFDADGDKDLDLYVVSGGNEFSQNSPDLQDRLYINKNGKFTKSSGRIPGMLTSGSCVKAADIDNDGDEDLFVGGRLTPMAYPLPPRSYILENDGKGNFADVTLKYNKSLLNPGMVTDALWTDFNGDGKADLIVTGEWMKIRFFRNDGAMLTEITEECGLKDSEGWWNTITAVDLDRDGDPDYVAGNLGLNSQLKASIKEPVTIYAKDFDNNGSVDALMCYYIQGTSYPFYGKDDLQDQMPFIEKKYPTYESYTNQKITDIFSGPELSDAIVLKATVFQTSYLENLGNNRFRLSPLPREAQYSPVYAINTGDYNKDGNTDILLAGNFFGTRIKFGEYDANKGLVLTGNGKGVFTPLGDQQSGLNIRGEVRDIRSLKLSSGKSILVFAINNDSVKIYGPAGEW
ncbi:MAG: VCBS repeat-containing protein [Bacteroidales bacterium]|nr:VCBS repeat-containing protein [Bacteroidales bacterium]